jgi:hypothetical protein
MISLKRLLEVGDPTPLQTTTNPPVATQQPAQSSPDASAAQDGSNEYSPAFDFNDFETKLAQATETAKNTFQEKLMSKVGGKKVLVRASKGQPGQPLKDYTIDVSGVSVDYYYDRYVVILKDEKEKEYFLNTMMKIKILGAAEVKTNKIKPQKQSTPTEPTAPAEPAPNSATQGI